MDCQQLNAMELKPTVQHHDLEAAEALVSMSVWGQRSHKPRPLTPTSDSCDSVHLLLGEGVDPAKDLIALSSLVRPDRSTALKTKHHHQSLIP